MIQPGARDRLGIFGGTFDPIHLGHLIIAQEAAHHLRLDRVLFVPTGQPPHKRDVATPAQRGAMVALAIADEPRFALCAVELDRPGPSYTADTIARLRADYPTAFLALLLGGDMVYDLVNWRDPAAIAGGVDCITAVARPGFTLDPVRLADLERQIPAARGRVSTVAAPLVAISATLIRRRVAAGEPVRYLIPDSVAAYIAAHGLYGGSHDMNGGSHTL